MLVKRIDANSIPVGLYECGEDIKKGSAVVLKGGKLYNPSTADEVNSILGLATLRIDTIEGGDVKDHDVIKAGKKAVVYTLFSKNMWATTEFDGTLAVGDSLTVSYSGETKGKLIKSGVAPADGKVLFTVVELSKAGSFDMVEVLVD